MASLLTAGTKPKELNVLQLHSLIFLKIKRRDRFEKV